MIEKLSQLSEKFDGKIEDVIKLAELHFLSSNDTFKTSKTILIDGIPTKMQFIIDRKGFSYFPMSDEISDKEALEKVSNLTYSRPISYKTDLEKAKTIALNSYSKSKEVVNILNESTDTGSLITKLSEIGVVLHEDVSVKDELIITEIPVDETLCSQSSEIKPSTYSIDELIEIEKDCCSDKFINDNTAEINSDLKNEEPDLSELSTIENFISDIDTANKTMQSCNKEKQNAINALYWYMEAQFLNEINLEYAYARSSMLDSLYQSIGTLENERLNKLSRTSYRDSESLNSITQKIENLKYTLKIPTFTNEQTSAFLTNGATFSPLIFQQEHSIQQNPISNQAGYFSGRLKLYVHQNIKDESKALFALGSPESGELESYLENLSIREKPFSDIWAKFYSSNRIDNLFTYSEQGYKSPKPQYDSKGTLVGNTETIKIGGKEQSVSSSILNLEVDNDIATNFWQNLESNTEIAIKKLISDLKDTETYKNYIAKIKESAENEAKYAYSINLIFQEFSYNQTLGNTQTSVNSSLSIFLNTPNIANQYRNQYRMVYDSISSFQNRISDKLDELKNFIELKKLCISNQENYIANKSAALASNSPNSPIKNDCESKLGYDPLGMKSSSDCPSIIKNCYWKEYTKLMQTVSLMPIPDDITTGQLSKRLFRYYSVGFQIPVPTPTPAILPTLASGIPDTMISIPLPIIWKHITTLNSPIGLFVIWGSICGPVPGVYIMYIDENAEPCFLLTNRGAIEIPADSLQVSDLDNASFVESIPNTTIDYEKNPIFLGGNDKTDTKNIDSPSNIIDELKNKIQSAVSNLKLQNPWNLNDDYQKSLHDRLKNNQDRDSIKEFLDNIKNSLTESVNSMNITPIKYPKDATKLKVPLNGSSEFVSSINNLIDAGLSSSEIGMTASSVSLKDTVRSLLDNENIEGDVIGKTKKEKEDAIKHISLEMLKNIASTINPEMLGLSVIISEGAMTNEPCFSMKKVEPLPLYAVAFIAMIQNLPNTINISKLDIAKYTSLDSITNLKDISNIIKKSIVDIVPNVELPGSNQKSVYAQIFKTSLLNFMKVKIRMPRNGVSQISIPQLVIKDVIKKTLIGSLEVLSIIADKSVDEFNFAFKMIFGSSILNLSSNDLKSFMISSLESTDEHLSDLKNSIPNFNSYKFESIKQKLFPSKNNKKKTSIQINPDKILSVCGPMLQALEKSPIPYQLVLISASQAPTRAIITKIYPFASKEILPTWEKMTLKNVPFVVWLDQLIATAQKQGGLGSDYVYPYF